MGTIEPIGGFGGLCYWFTGINCTPDPRPSDAHRRGRGVRTDDVRLFTPPILSPISIWRRFTADRDTGRHPRRRRGVLRRRRRRPPSVGRLVSRYRCSFWLCFIDMIPLISTVGLATTPLLDPILAWGASHSLHLHYRIATVLDYIDLFIFIHILGPAPYGTSPLSLILLCTLLSLSVGRHCFYSSRCPTVSLFIVLSVIVARPYRAIMSSTAPTQILESRSLG